LPHGRISLLNVEVAVAFAVSVEDKGGSMVADHDCLLPRRRGKRGQPAALLIHANVGFDHVLLLWRIQQQLQWVQGTIRVPKAVIRVEVVSMRGMNGMVIASEILAILGDIGHASQRPVESRVEDGALPLRAAGDSYPVKRVVPGRSCV